MSIRKRDSKKAKNGFVYEVYFNYTNSEGIPSRYSKSGFATKKEAQLHETEKKQELLTHGTIKKEVKITLNQAINEFLEIGTTQYQPNTITRSKKDFKIIRAILGNYPLKEITYKVLQDFFNKRSSEGIEANKSIKNSINRVFVFSIRSGYITSNPLTYVQITGVQKKSEKKIISFQDFNTLIQQLHDQNQFKSVAYSIALKLGYYCGLRVSEVCALEKKDFDLVNGFVSLNKKLVYDGRKISDFEVIDQMKSNGSKAILPLPSAIIEDLKVWFKVNPHEIVVCDETGMYISPNVMYEHIKKITEPLGIAYNFHMLRHTYATNLVMGNVNVKTAQELMRHSNINTTLSVYTHVNMETKKEAVNDVFNSQSVEKVSNLKTFTSLN